MIYIPAAASSEKVRAKFNFDATSDKQLSLKAGDIISVVEKHASGWFKGECNGAVGLFPSNYTEVVVEAASAVVGAAPGDDLAQAKVAELKAKRMARLQARNSASPEVAASTIQRLVRSKSQTKRSESLSSGPKVEVVRAVFSFKSTSESHLSLTVGDVVTVIDKHASGWYKGECNGAIGLFPSNYTEPIIDSQQASGSGISVVLKFVSTLVLLPVLTFSAVIFAAAKALAQPAGVYNCPS